MYKLNNIEYKDENEVVKVLNEYLTKFIEENEKLKQNYQDIIDNAPKSSLKIDDNQKNVLDKLVASFKNTCSKKIAKMEMKQQKIIDSKDLKELVKDVNKSIKLYPKVVKANAKRLEQFKGVNDEYQIEIVKVYVYVTQKIIEAFQRQKEMCNLFIKDEIEK